MQPHIKWSFIFVLLVSAQFMGCSDQKKDNRNEITTSSGLRYQVLKSGTGEAAKMGQKVLIHESMGYMNGTQFYATKDMGSPVKILLGGNQAIKGVEEGAVGMQVGEIRKLIVPPALSKRKEYPSFLSPDSTLLYEIELVQIIK